MPIYITNNKNYKLNIIDSKIYIKDLIDKKNIKSIKNFNLPLQYQNTLISIYNYFDLSFKNELKFFYVIGGCAREKVIDTVSDIDLIVVLNDLSICSKKMINLFLNSFKIKVGISLYSQIEFQNKIMDARAMTYIYCYNIGYYSACFDEISNFPNILFDELKRLHYGVYLERIHLFKRYVFDNINRNYDLYLLIKKMKTIMAISLVEVNILAFDYDEVFNLFYIVFGYEKFVLNINDENYVTNYVFRFIEFLEKFVFNAKSNNYLVNYL